MNGLPSHTTLDANERCPMSDCHFCSWRERFFVKILKSCIRLHNFSHGRRAIRCAVSISIRCTGKHVMGVKVFYALIGMPVYDAIRRKHWSCYLHKGDPTGGNEYKIIQYMRQWDEVISRQKNLLEGGGKLFKHCARIRTPYRKTFVNKRPLGNRNQTVVCMRDE